MRGKLAILCIVTLVVLTGCMHSGGDSSGSAEPIENVPSQADFLMQIDGGVLEDPTTEQLVDASIEMSMENNDSYDGPESYDEWLNNLSSETDIDPTAFGSGVAFGEIPENSSGFVQPQGEQTNQYFGFVFTAEWTEDEMVELIEQNATVSEEEYSGTTIYVIEPETEETDSEFGSQTQDTGYAAVLPDGTYSFGTEESVQDTIDVVNGDTEAVGGELREEFDRVRDGYITFTATIPDYDLGNQDTESPSQGTTGPGGQGMGAGFESFGNVTVASGAYYTSGEDTIGMEMNMRTDSEEDAQNIQDGIDGLISLAALSGDAFSSALDPAEVSLDGTTVAVEYEVTVDEAIQILEDLEEFQQQQQPPGGAPGGSPGGEFGSGTGSDGFGGQSGGSDFGTDGTDSGGSFNQSEFEDEFGSGGETPQGSSP